jgi:hypothetical protein
MKAVSAFFIQPSALVSWLPDMDLNHDKVIQSHLCYRYTIGHAGASGKLMSFAVQSSRQAPNHRVHATRTMQHVS